MFFFFINNCKTVSFCNAVLQSYILHIMRGAASGELIWFMTGQVHHCKMFMSSGSPYFFQVQM